jgi:hypothetical protein
MSAMSVVPNLTCVLGGDSGNDIWSIGMVACVAWHGATHGKTEGQGAQRSSSDSERPGLA